MKNKFKSFLLLLSMSLLTFSNFAQDLIVTSEDDSLNCKITKVSKENVYFTFKHRDEIRSTLLSKSNIKTHQFNFYQKSEVSLENVVGYEKFQRFRVAINGGYSYQIGKVSEDVPSDFKNYVKELKSGYHFGGDLTYFISEPLGVGIKYYVFKSSNSMNSIYADDPYGNRRYGRMSDDISISFIGPSFTTRLLDADNLNAFIMSVSLGYTNYKNNKVMIDKYTMSGSTLGMALDLGYDIKLSKELALGFQISLISASLMQYEWNDGTTTKTIKLEAGKYESLYRCDLSVGLRFNK